MPFCATQVSQPRYVIDNSFYFELERGLDSVDILVIIFFFGEIDFLKEYEKLRCQS